jgi:hypothetical protein
MQRRWPAILLGGLLLCALLAGVGFWIGRRTAPTPPPVPRGPTVTIPVATVEPIPMPQVLVPAKPEADPTPTAGQSDPPAPAAKQVTRGAPHQATRPPPVKSTRAVRPVRAAPRPRIVAATPPPSAGGAGQVIDLGRYLSPRRADAAWRATIARYPYLAGLPKVVAPTAKVPGRPRLYRLQIGARSPNEARILCRNLITIGRPCTVM